MSIDAGNTKVTLGIYDESDLKEICNFQCKNYADYNELKDLLKSAVSGYQIDCCMISSVVDELTENLEKAVKENFNIVPLQITPKINLGIKICTSEPEKCGSDRIANAYAASVLYSHRPIIVIDSGSATTFDIVNNFGEFVGGVILPGMELQLKALGEKTSKLPILDLRNVSSDINVISDNTEEAIYAGVVVAHAQAIQGLIKLCEQKLKQKAFIVGTGGNIGIVSRYMTERTFDVINTHLTLDGIRLLYELNK